MPQDVRSATWGSIARAVAAALGVPVAETRAALSAALEADPGV